MIRILAAALLCLSGLAAIDLDIQPEDVDRALAIGRRTDAGFHKPYVREIETTTDAITVRQVEVLTAFRRLVLYAEARRRAAEFLVSRADVAPLVRQFGHRVSIVATVRFHPQNVLTSPPPIDLSVFDPILEQSVPPLETRRTAIITPGRPRPLLGATIETVFDAGLLASLDAPVVISLHRKELARTTIDFRVLD